MLGGENKKSLKPPPRWFFKISSPRWLFPQVVQPSTQPTQLRKPRQVSSAWLWYQPWHPRVESVEQNHRKLKNIAWARNHCFVSNKFKNRLAILGFLGIFCHLGSTCERHDSNSNTHVYSEKNERNNWTPTVLVYIYIIFISGVSNWNACVGGGVNCQL